MSQTASQQQSPSGLAAGVTLIDTHCHLDMDDYAGDLAAVLAEARQAGVAEIITVGIDLASSRRAVALADEHEGVFATVGVHPHHVEELNEAGYAALRRLAEAPRVVAYGEIGLDYVKQYAPQPLQREHFRRQVLLGKELGLPLVIHDREAHDVVMTILEEAGPFPAGGVMHCFSGDTKLARRVLDLGFFVSIPGVVTFKTAEAMREVARMVPLDWLLLETDGPFLAPVPMRGKRNHPALMVHTARLVAQVRGISLDELATATTANAKRLFRLEG
ncbi:MAG: TatD family hydrolase [Thermodesulfobacteriota bacterium]